MNSDLKTYEIKNEIHHLQTNHKLLQNLKSLKDKASQVSGVMAWVAKWLDHPHFVQRVPGSKPPSDLSQNGTICWLSVILGKRAKESPGTVTPRGRTRVTLMSLPIQWALNALCINQYLTKIVSVSPIINYPQLKLCLTY